jgi:DNA invertase Pin-like site-specific DNA recombinase
VQRATENQRRVLDEVAERAGWQVVEIYADEISGTKAASAQVPHKPAANLDSGVRRSLILR